MGDLSPLLTNTILRTDMEEPQSDSSETIEELRLFPLNVVLFPGVQLPLRIFEERYKLMINECLEANAPFGIVLIQEGMEVGGAAKPNNTGTTARITKVEKLEEGRMNLATIGESRFQILETNHDSPYLKGQVQYLPDELGELGEGVLEKTRGLFDEYLRNLASLRGGWMRRADVPDDPKTLSYTIAHYLNLPARAKQRLLELPFVGERLYYEISLLEGANKRLTEELAKRTPFKGPRLN